jgi:thiosulfate/3-mercaptopyruvate sulfurtransferase
MTARAPFRRIGVGDAQTLLAREGVVVLDVRAVDAFAQGHIEGARRVTMADLSGVLASTPKDAPVLIYCYRGNASQEYAQIFSDFRFQDVYSLDGGYEAWSLRARG